MLFLPIVSAIIGPIVLQSIKTHLANKKTQEYAERYMHVLGPPHAPVEDD